MSQHFIHWADTNKTQYKPQRRKLTQFFKNWTESVLDRPRSRKSTPTDFGADSGETNSTKVVDIFDGFPESISTCLYDQRFRSYDLYNLEVLLKFSFGQNEMSGQIWDLTHFQDKTRRTLNTKFIDHFRTFLTSGRTQSFDSEQESYDQSKLIKLTRYDF
jgi:hypothetical protein